MVEHRTFNPMVLGSNPRRSNIRRVLGMIRRSGSVPLQLARMCGPSLGTAIVCAEVSPLKWYHWVADGGRIVSLRSYHVQNRICNMLLHVRLV